MNTVQQEVDERTNLTGTNKFELLLFRLGGSREGDRSELYGINVFKVREIVAMPDITAIAGALPHVLGVVNLRGQIIQVINLPAAVGCKPRSALNILLVTEYARTIPAFAVESVEEIVRLDWSDVLSAEASSVGGTVTSIASIDGNTEGTRLAQVLDVEQILWTLSPPLPKISTESPGQRIQLPPGTVILAADDSGVARAMIEASLTAMGAPYIMTKSGKEAWEKLQSLAASAEKEGKTVSDKVALVLTDLEMPEMDGFTLTGNIKQAKRFKSLPVVIHSSLSGTTNEAHVKSVGADAYDAKFSADELAGTLRNILSA
ncbi:MAG: chemotaxis protein [Pseudomonadota bacterium]